MKLIARKPCSFGGKQFFIGDEIPAEFVVNPVDQEKMGVLVCVTQEHPAPPVEWNFTLAIPQEDGSKLILDFDLDGMTGCLSALVSKPEAARAIIEEMTCNDALVFLHMVDVRKSVKAAAEARGKALEEAGDQ